MEANAKKHQCVLCQQLAKVARLKMFQFTITTTDQSEESPQSELIMKKVP